MSGWKRYMENEIKTSNPAKVTILAYERIILTLKKVSVKIEEKKYDEASESLEKIHKVVNELSIQINHDVFPELAADLDRLYYWIGTEVQIINSSKDNSRIKPVILVLQDLLDAYREVLEKNE